MTVFQGIESVELQSRTNDIKAAIINNEYIEEKLHVIMVISNPCNYKTRWRLAKEFIKRIEKTKDIILYRVELVYNNQPYIITDSDNPYHLQLRTNIPIWHKENMINIAVKRLLPTSWKAMAWIDADLDFESLSWASDTLKILNGSRDIVQLFSHCLDMDKYENTMQIFNSFGYQYASGKKYMSYGPNFWHPGFAWACTRRAYETMGGLFELGILGAGDHHMAQAIISNTKSLSDKAHPNYKKHVVNLVRNMSNLRLGYVPGVIRHFFHGSKKNRKYSERWQILVNHQYNPDTHLIKDVNGVLVPSAECPVGLLDDIMNYFRERKEDE